MADKDEGPVSSMSLVDPNSDPFATREGKTLLWTNVNMTLTAKGDDPERKILTDVWGEVPSRETVAVMGPSGAGKSSVLNVLAGRSSSHGRLVVNADVRLNNYSVNPADIQVRKSIAFVAQDDSLQVTATPREAIKFSAKLRLPQKFTDEQLDALTERMISELGLVSCADTIVGGELIKGISGGERKRTSVGVELVVRPALVFLDEPTSGLDSFSAVQLCQVLKKVANAGASVLFTIHQPSSEIFNSFDRLILMNKGRVMYQGPVTEAAAYFGERGHPNPPKYNTADWVMDVAQSVPVEELDKKGFFPKDERQLEDPLVPEDGKDPLGITVTGRFSPADPESHPPGAITQTTMLFTREVANLQRDVSVLGARMGVSIFGSLMVGIIFWDVGSASNTERSNVQSRFGAVMMLLIFSMFGTAQPAILSFPSERPVFLREYSTNHYSVASYFFSRLTMEAVVTFAQLMVMTLIQFYCTNYQGRFINTLVTAYSLAMASTALAVMLGSNVEDPKLAQELLPLLFVPQMLLSGFFVAPELIPTWLQWAQYICPLTYAARIAVIEEFDNCTGEKYSNVSNCTDVEATIGTEEECQEEQNCNMFLENVKADEDETWWYWCCIVGLFWLFRLVALYLLRQKASVFY